MSSMKMCTNFIRDDKFIYSRHFPAGISLINQWTVTLEHMPVTAIQPHWARARTGKVVGPMN